MPVDYSKWDALELSDDSDIEVHPNVDKKSFIRAKQNQIHQERAQRKHQIETLKYERIINDGFLTRIDHLLNVLKSHTAEAEKRSPDEVMFQAIMESAADSKTDQPPPRPEGVHSESGELPRYSKMLATLVDQVKTKVDETKAEDGYSAYIEEVKEHEAKIVDLQRQLVEKLAELEAAEGKKITSESYATGFNTSSVSKEKAPAPAPAKNTKKEKVQAVEVLNPGALANSPTSTGETQSSGADADIDEPEDSDDEADVDVSPIARKFGNIKIGDFQSSMRFISQNPNVIAEKETDGLLVLAFNEQMEGKEDFARQCVHQALLLQYCRSLGRDGVGLFFKRITTQGHQAQKVFYDDVNQTYGRIKTRVKEILKEREAQGEESGMVESIQLHAVEPGTAINIKVPPKESTDEKELASRKLFEAFPPGLQRALESGSLDEVNKVLGKMSVEEAEEIVGQLGEGDMLSLEEQIIDATTEEGQEMMKQIEEQERLAKEGKIVYDDPE